MATATESETQRVRRLQDRAAPKYDRMIAVFERILFEDGREWACSQVRGNVLEIAIGTGRNLVHYPPGTEVTGIELSAEMLALARRRAAALPWEPDLREGDAQALEFPDASFDSVLITLALCTIPDDRAAVREAHRVLRPGGRLVLVEHVRSPVPVVRALQRLIDPLSVRFEGDHVLRDPLDHLADAGFVVETVARRKWGIVERAIANQARRGVIRRLEVPGASSVSPAKLVPVVCAAIDIGSNTTRVLVAEPDEGQLRTVMEQRAYTRIGKASKHEGRIDAEKVAEVAEVVATQVRLAQEVGAEAIRTVATAAIREADNRDEVVGEISRIGGVPVEVLSEEEEGRLAFIGATKTLGHPVEGEIAVVDVGGGSSEIVLGTVPGGARSVRSFKIGSGALAEDFLEQDPPSPSEIRRLRDHIEEFFADVEIEHPEQAVAVGGSATSLRRLVGAVLEYETLERAVRVLAGDPIAEVARRFELDARRVRLLPAGVLLLEKLSELLGQPLQIGKGGLREGIILDLLNGATNGAEKALAA